MCETLLFSCSWTNLFLHLSGPDLLSQACFPINKKLIFTCDYNSTHLLFCQVNCKRKYKNIKKSFKPNNLSFKSNLRRCFTLPISTVALDDKSLILCVSIEALTFYCQANGTKCSHLFLSVYSLSGWEWSDYNHFLHKIILKFLRFNCRNLLT